MKRKYMLVILCLLFVLLVGCTQKESTPGVKLYACPIENLQFGMNEADTYAALSLDVPAENTVPSLDIGEILGVPTHRCTLHFTAAKDLDLFPLDSVLTSVSFTVTDENLNAMLAALKETYGSPATETDGLYAWAAPAEITSADAKLTAAMLMMYNPQFMLPNPRTAAAADLLASIKNLSIPDAALPFIRVEPAGIDDLWLVTVNAGAYALHDPAKEAIS
ncbi:MAG: hypothetical protein IKU17_02495 [Clostridia bacterium]|nr:hypothetical protein [Clostridia bacterium]